MLLLHWFKIRWYNHWLFGAGAYYFKYHYTGWRNLDTLIFQYVFHTIFCMLLKPNKSRLMNWTFRILFRRHCCQSKKSWYFQFTRRAFYYYCEWEYTWHEKWFFVGSLNFFSSKHRATYLDAIWDSQGKVILNDFSLGCGIIFLGRRRVHPAR